MRKKVALIILDGWGHGKGDASDAIAQAHTPFVDALYHKYPSAQLRTDGAFVGLPDGQMGNSEVGHMNIGAGRIVYQDLAKINKSVAEGRFAQIPLLTETFTRVAKTGSRMHFIGLLGHGGVHAEQGHLVALCKLAQAHGVEQAFIHAFTDGRDTDPKSGAAFMTELESDIASTGVRVASLIGRYFAMDRDKRWERVKKAYDLLVHGKGRSFNSASEAIQYNYKAAITDEFIEPSLIASNGKPLAKIQDGDTVICFNFRTDRCREITEVLTQRDMPEYEMHRLSLDYITMTRYDEQYKGLSVVFEKDNLKMTLGEVLSKKGKSQVRIAETEKYPHVTFFFSGGREAVFEGEQRMMVHSPKVATYDMQPEMSAFAVRDRIVESMQNDPADFVCLNFANADMVGHTGVFTAIVSACEAVDACLKDVVEAGSKAGYSFVIIADHGNADLAVNPDGSPNTAHSKNPVPLVVIDPEVSHIHNGILADVAPTILNLMGIDQPDEMSGRSLLGS